MSRRLTSNPPTNGIIVSFSLILNRTQIQTRWEFSKLTSGLSGPISVQNCVNPSLIDWIWLPLFVRLNNTAKEFPSWGSSVVVVCIEHKYLKQYVQSTPEQHTRSLSLNIPAVSFQSSSLYASLMEEALAVYAAARLVFPSAVASSEAVIKVWEAGRVCLCEPILKCLSYLIQECICSRVMTLSVNSTPIIIKGSWDVHQPSIIDLTL